MCMTCAEQKNMEGTMAYWKCEKRLVCKAYAHTLTRPSSQDYKPVWQPQPFNHHSQGDCKKDTSRYQGSSSLKPGVILFTVCCCCFQSLWLWEGWSASTRQPWIETFHIGAKLKRVLPLTLRVVINMMFLNAIRPSCLANSLAIWFWDWW